MEERLYTWAVHMENKKTGEKQIQKVKADDAINAHSKLRKKGGIYEYLLSDLGRGAV